MRDFRRHADSGGDVLVCIDMLFEREAAEADRNATRTALEDAQAHRRGMWSAAEPLAIGLGKRAETIGAAGLTEVTINRAKR